MKSLEIRNGIWLLMGFIAYFFIMKGLGLYTNVNLRVLNIFIHGSIVYLTMKAFRQNKSSEFSYLETFLIGMRTSVVAVIGFAFFQFVYLEFLNPDFMTYIQENALLGSLLSPFKASLFLVMEGLGVSIFTSYVGMRVLTIRENVPALS